MSVSKKDIAKNISSKLSIGLDQSSKFLESFLSSIKANSKLKIFKLSGFGSFNLKNSPERIGRNPITKESYIIYSRKKLTFKVSSKIKESLN
tara:strand:+ start:26963 stop:27238 length:276 start_codon:yes stop_codon:yes gene_type:complete